MLSGTSATNRPLLESCLAAEGAARARACARAAARRDPPRRGSSGQAARGPVAGRRRALPSQAGSVTEPLSWRNSILLPGDAASAVAELRRREGKDLVIMGSGKLTRSLVEAGLIDEFVLLIHPLILGKGRRLFPAEGPRVPLRLLACKTTDAGVIVASYRPET
jgi:dihydrofolate reductase